jgi:predicted AAA+ superfamily ATPase
MFFYRGNRYGIEVKFSEAPEVTRSMHTALQDLGLEQLWVLYSDEDSYPVHEKITIYPLQSVGDLRQFVTSYLVFAQTARVSIR